MKVKTILAVGLNALLVPLALLSLPTTFTFYWHKPTVPQELLKK